ncbi:unnamed protein product [Didymodactylos carnosus]|uniref:Cadherin domain-containing protein n=1 Tax=Didymodactylos carnosus TaxID=1234261 RepID=A0A8S2NYI5_9BILA|nr:unnamed protein product [Didymodactylos carnosus]CAF4018600.1 unnamed protein product [Didymodactylos carnosus]
MMIIHFLIYSIMTFSFIFTNTINDVLLREELPIGSIVYDLKKLSQQRNQPSTYQLLESSSLFTFNSTTNLITVAKRIDRDTLCPNDENCNSCIFKIKLYDMMTHSIILLNIIIEDVNDNAPIFSSNLYSIQITENNMPGIKIRLSKADDIDCSQLNGVQFYELQYVKNGNLIKSSISIHHKEAKNGVGIDHSFYLLYDSFELYLVVNMSLDRELQSEYKFTITANDNLHSTTTNLTLIVLDVNDHNARFSQSIYSVNVSETTPSETILLKLNAFDSDEGANGRLHYSIINVDGIKIVPNSDQSFLIPFHLDSKTGELRLVTTSTHNLNYEMKKVYKLTVSATDGGIGAIPALATVYVHIVNENDNLPVITLTFGSNKAEHNLSEVYISENQPNSTFIAYVTIGYRDLTTTNNNLKWEVLSSDLKSNSLPGFFVQKLTSNTFTLLTDHSYDRENQTFYSVVIRVKEELTIVEKHFRIIVTDLNDNPPIFNSSIFDIDLDEYPLSMSKLIFTLRATDADIGDNGKVSYMKKSLSWPYWINLIDNNTGIAYLTINCSQIGNNSSSDDGWFHLSNGEIWLEIEAYDHGKPQLSSTAKIRLFRSSIIAILDKTNEEFNSISTNILHRRSSQLLNWFKNEYVIIALAVTLAILLLSITFFVCCCIRIKHSRHNNSTGTINKSDRWKKKSTSLITTIVRDDNNHNKKIIQSSSSSNNDEHSSSGSLCSEKSDNVTVETAASCNMVCSL